MNLQEFFSNKRNLAFTLILGGIILVIVFILIFSTGSGKKAGKIPLQDSTAVKDSLANITKTDSLAKVKAKNDSVMVFTSTTPWDLAKMINDKKVEKVKWNKEVDEIQKITTWLYQESQDLRPDNNLKWQTMLNMAGGRTTSQTQPLTQQPVSPVTGNTSSDPKILNEISADVKEIKKDLKEHRIGAKSSHQQTVTQRNRIEDGISNLDTQIILARGEVAVGIEELKKVKESGDKSKIDHQMQNLQLRMEGLERLLLKSK